MVNILKQNETLVTSESDEIAQLKSTLDDKIKAIRAEPTFTRPKKSHVILSVFQKIPVLASLIGQVKSGKKAIDSLVQLKQAQTVELPKHLETIPAVSIPFTYIGLINSILDFIKLPLVYVASLVLGQPPPTKLTALAQWLYSALLLALTIVSLLLPPTAPIIGGAMIILGFGSSIYFWDQFKKEKAKLTPEIEVLEGEVGMLNDVISQQKIDIEREILSIQHNNNPTKKELELYIDIVTNYQEILSIPKARLQEVMQTKLQKEGELKSMGNLAELDKVVTVFLSTLALIGLLFSLLFPPLGLVLLNVAIFSGVVYTLGRIVIPPVAPTMQKLFARLHAAPKSPQEPLPSPTTPVTPPSISVRKSLEEESKFFSSPIQPKIPTHQEPQEQIDKTNQPKV